MRPHNALATACLVFFAMTPSLRAAPVATAVAVETAPVVDGKLDDAVWRRAKPAGGFHPLMPGRKKVHATTFRAVYTPEALYLGIRCAEENTGALKADGRRKAAVFQDDSVEIFVVPTESKADYYQFVVNANGTQGIYYWMENKNIRDTAYDALWESRTFVGKGFWSIEVALPWHVFNRTHAKDIPEDWTFNIARNRFGGTKKCELSTWSPLKRSFHEPDNFGTLKGIRYDKARYDYRFELPEVVAEPTADGLALEVRAAFLNRTGRHRNLRARCLLVEPAASTAPQTFIARKRIRNAVTFTGLAVPKPGKYDLMIELRDSDKGLPCAVYRWTADIAFRALALELDRPFYRNNIYPTQRIERIEGRLLVYLPEKKTRGARAIIRFLDGSKELARHETPVTAGALAFRFDARNLKDGEYTIKGELVGVDGKTLAEKSVTLRKLPPFDGTVTRLDRELNLVVNGEPAFALGWYGQCYRLGVGTPIPFKLTRAVNITSGIDLDKAARNGILAIVGLAPERLCGKRLKELRIKEDVEPPDFVKDAARKVIEKFRHHPALGAWYISDEPECRAVSPVWLRRYYEFIRELDPYHVTVICSRRGETFAATTDVVSSHSYLSPRMSEGKIVFTRPMTKIRRDILATFRGGKGRTAAWTTPQAFTYARFPEDCPPTFLHERCMFYTAVVSGAKGIMPYIFHDARGMMDLRIGIDAMYETLHHLSPVLLAPGREELTVVSDGDAVLALAKRTGNDITIFAVNTTEKAVKAVLKSPALAGLKDMLVVREDRLVRPAGGEFADAFGPYGVHVYTTIQTLPYMETIAQIDDRIERELAAGAKEGNLIYRSASVRCFDASGLQYRVLPFLVDGVYDHPAWLGFKSRWLEVAFGRESVISRVVVSSVNLRDYEVHAWVDGEWKKVSGVRGNRLFRVEHRFEPTATVKIRIVCGKTRTGPPEIAEVEVYK